MGVSVLESYDRGDKECCLSDEKKEEVTFIDYQAAVGEDAIELRASHLINLDPMVTITAISSGGRVMGQADNSTGVDENDMSVSLLISFRGFKAFYGGDIEQPTEAKIAALDLVTDVDLYKATRAAFERLRGSFEPDVFDARDDAERHVGLANEASIGMTLTVLLLGTALRNVGGQPFTRRKQFLFVHDVVAIEHRARLVTGE